MKKFLSVFVVCIFMVSVMFVLTGCGDNSLNVNLNTPIDNPNTDIDSSNYNTPVTPATNDLKVINAFAPLLTKHYYIKLLADVENVQGLLVKNATMEITVDGNNFATDIKDAGYGMITKDDSMYYIMHDAKQYTQMTLQENTKQEMLSQFNKEDYTNEFVESGSKDLNGKTYYFEKFIFDGDTTTLYFEGNNVKYIESTYLDGTPTTIMEIVELTNTSKTSLLEIPSGYTPLTFD